MLVIEEILLFQRFIFLGNEQTKKHKHSVEEPGTEIKVSVQKICANDVCKHRSDRRM